VCAFKDFNSGVHSNTILQQGCAIKHPNGGVHSNRVRGVCIQNELEGCAYPSKLNYIFPALRVFLFSLLLGLCLVLGLQSPCDVSFLSSTIPIFFCSHVCVICFSVVTFVLLAFLVLSAIVILTDKKCDSGCGVNLHLVFTGNVIEVYCPV